MHANAYPGLYALVQVLHESSYRTTYLVPMDQISPDLKDVMQTLHSTSGTDPYDTAFAAQRQELLAEIERLASYIYDDRAPSSLPVGVLIAHICQL